MKAKMVDAVSARGEYSPPNHAYTVTVLTPAISAIFFTEMFFLMHIRPIFTPTSLPLADLFR